MEQDGSCRELEDVFVSLNRSSIHEIRRIFLFLLYFVVCVAHL